MLFADRTIPQTAKLTSIILGEKICVNENVVYNNINLISMLILCNLHLPYLYNQQFFTSNLIIFHSLLTMIFYVFT